VTQRWTKRKIKTSVRVSISYKAKNHAIKCAAHQTAQWRRNNIISENKHRATASIIESKRQQEVGMEKERRKKSAA